MVVKTVMHSHFVVVNWLDVVSVIKFVIQTFMIFPVRVHMHW